MIHFIYGARSFGTIPQWNTRNRRCSSSPLKVLTNEAKNRGNRYKPVHMVIFQRVV